MKHSMDRRIFLKQVTWAGTGLALSRSARALKSSFSATPAGSPQGIPWVSMRGNRQNTGVSPFVGFRFTPNGDLPILRWADTNDPNNPTVLSLINATPIIGPGDIIYIGSSNSHFYSFAPRSPNQSLESLPVGNIVDSAGCFTSPELLYFPCGDFSLYECPVDHIEDASAHKMTMDGGSPSTIHWFEGNVVADVNNRLYAGNDDFYLYCCDPSQSEYPLWLFATGFFVWSACAFSPDNKTLYFASADMTVYALDLTQSGTPVERWTYPAPNICTSSVAVDSNNVVYFGSFNGGIYALDGKTGTKLWEHQTKSLIYASPAISDDGVLYIISSDGVLRALDTHSGTPVWEFFTGMPSFSSASLGPDPEQKSKYLIYIGTGNGEVLALDPSGNRRWSFDISTLYSRNSDPRDPAFWSSFRYPAINSSLAIGSNGIATATSGGLILWIDYLYYTNRPLPEGINTSPVDNYVHQLGSEGSFCYISPSGRMAESILSPANSNLAIYPTEVITLTFLEKKTSTSGKKRASFATLPQNLQISSPDGGAVTWRESADRRQLYVEPISAPAAPRNLTLSANGQNLASFTVNYRSVPSPLSQSDLLNQRFEVQQPSFFSPFIVPALDQLGLATIAIPFRVVNFVNSVNSVEGSLWAYGYESYSAGAAGAAARNLLYVFTGSYQNGNLILASRPSYFELTSFPTPVTTMKVTGTVGRTDSKLELTGLSLLVEYTETTNSLLNWLCQLLDHWLGIDIPGVNSVCDLLNDPGLRTAEIDRVSKQLEAGTSDSFDVWIRILFFIGRLAGNFQSILDDWKLFNGSQFAWVGTYKFAKYSPQTSPPTVQKTSFHYDPTTFSLTATLEFAQNLPTVVDFVVGIVILARNVGPLNLNYTNLNKPPATEGTTLTQAIDLTGVALAGCKAVVFVNLEMLPQEYTFQS